MKKLSLSLLAISFFITVFCGCNIESKVKINTDFNCECSIIVEDIALTLNVLSLEGENVAVEVLAPDNLKGLKYERVNSNLYIDYNGLKCTACADYLTSYNPFDILIDSLVSIKSSELKFMCEEDGFDVYNGKGVNGEYTVFVEKSSGNIKKLKPIYAKYEFDFAY